MEAEEDANPPEFYIPGNYTDEELVEQLELQEAEYRLALLKLKKAAPQLELCVPELVKGVPAARETTRCGPCGRGRLPLQPWALCMESLGHCVCDVCDPAVHECRMEIMDAYDPELFFADREILM